MGAPASPGEVALSGSTPVGGMIAGWAGLLHGVLAIVASVALTGEIDQPSWTAEAAEIVSFYRGADFDITYVTGVLMVAASFLLLFVFLAIVADLVGRTDGVPLWMVWLIVGGAALEMAFGIFGYLAAFGAAVFRADHGGLTDASALLLHDLRFAFYWLDLLAMALWMMPLGVAIIRTSLLPHWVGWAFLVNAVALLPAFYMPPNVWDPLSGLPILWVLVLAIWMLRARYVPDHGTDSLA